MERYSKFKNKVGRLNIVKILALPNLIYGFNEIPIKISESYYVDIDKLILKFKWRSKRFRIANTVLKERNKVGGPILLDFKTYFRAITMNTMWL